MSTDVHTIDGGQAGAAPLPVADRPRYAVAMERVGEVADGLVRAIEVMLGAGMAAAVLLNFANVVGRYAFGQAIVGADEVLVYAMIATIFLGCAVVTWRDGHLKMDVLIARAPPRLQAGAARLCWLTLAAVAATVAWSSAEVVAEMQAFGQRSLAANVPMSVPHGAVAAGMALTAAFALLRAFGVGPAARPTFPVPGGG